MQKRKYEYEHLLYDDLKNSVSIPQFQRSLVWSDRQKDEFIRTVKEGRPFGSILVYKSMEKYEIIDGLQRFTTLKNCEENPADYLKINEENYPEILDIVELVKGDIPRLSDELLKKTIIDSIKETLSNTSFSDQKLSRKIRKSIVDRYADAIPTKTTDNIEDCILNMIQKWRDEIDFRILRIPTIIYTGDRSDLPDIFETINQKGTKLSRYQVFASTWDSVRLKIEREDLLEYIEDLYKKKSERANLSITNYEEGSIKSNKIISLYELCFAFGKKIKDACSILFKTYSDTEEDQVDSIGFTSLATIIGIPLTKLASLDKYINGRTNVNNLLRLMDQIVDSYKKVEDILKNYISTVDGKVFTKFIEAQILAIVGTHFSLFNRVNPNDLSLTQVSVSRIVKENYKAYMPYAYLYEIISDYWAGTGDKKLAEELSKPINDNRYCSLILKDRWETLLRDWMSGQITKKVKNVAIENKLFLNFICKPYVWHDNQIKYDIEHIIPKKRIANKHMDVAISAMGNLCLLPVCDNRRKKDLTVYEYLDTTSEITNIDEEKALQLFYPTRDELAFIRAGASFNEANYNRYLIDRNNYLIKEFLKGVK